MDDRKNPRLTGAQEKFDESFNIMASLLVNLMLGRTGAPVIALYDQLGAALKVLDER